MEENLLRTRVHLQAVGAINSISRSPRAVPRLKKAGFQTEVLFDLLWARDLSASVDLRKLTVAWYAPMFGLAPCSTSWFHTAVLIGLRTQNVLPFFAESCSQLVLSSGLLTPLRVQCCSQYGGIRSTKARFATAPRRIAAMVTQQGWETSNHQYGQVLGSCAERRAVVGFFFQKIA